MGGTPVLDGCCSMDLRNNQPNNGVGGWRGGGEEIRTGGMRGGGRLVIVIGGKWSDEKNTNKCGDGASDFDDFCWIGGHNNQPKIDRIVKQYLG